MRRDNLNIFKMALALLMFFFGGFQIIFADTPPPPPPSSENQTEFQDWLKNNKQMVLAQNTVTTTVPSANTPTTPPPLAPPQTLPPQTLPPQTIPVGNRGNINNPPLGQPAAPSLAPGMNLNRRVTTVTRQIRSSRVITLHQTNGDYDSPVKTAPMSFQRSQAIMRKAAPPSQPPSPIATAAFNNMMRKNMPLTPDQVIRLRQLIDLSQRAAAVPANVPPKPVSTTLMINLAPGSTPPAIRLSQGYVSSLVFVDSAGNPWPIESYDVGDPKATTIHWEPKSNILVMQAVSPYGDSNLVIRLIGLPTPVTLQLVSGQRVVDFRVDLHISGIGPNTKDLPTGVMLPASANQILLNVLDGVAPGGSRLLTVTGGDAQAWLLGDRMFFRTRFTVLSPGWIGKMNSPDGMIAYEMQRTSSVLVSQYGEPVEFKVGGF